ncbi:FAS1-like dehydratase domain-containing protein [Roseiarcus sp.]|uniref:FAS1-like dehydratase domain-containing protein n=1 Tax=Roseiarcus sp. TaxID=1969460 RepID=UPI003F95412F
MSAISPDGVSFEDWVGRSYERTDTLTTRLGAEFTATFAPNLPSLPGAPLGLFWTLAPDIEPPINLGQDAHPRLGLYLPPLPFPRRMWAGGELKFEGLFAIGDAVKKTSTIESVVFKTGATGPLAFVAVRHVYAIAGCKVLDERQDIVYRAPSGESGKPTPASPADPLAAFTVEATPTLLFRYSAMTFNGHRIHYDFPYATHVEGYAGLVVHGPMQATLMLNAAAQALGRPPKTFRYRGLSPLIAGHPFRVEAFAAPEGGLATRVVSTDGVVAMSGTATDA